MTEYEARACVGQSVCTTVGIKQPNGPFLPAGSTFLLEIINQQTIGLSWQSPRGRLTMELPKSALSHFKTRAAWLA